PPWSRTRHSAGVMTYSSPSPGCACRVRKTMSRYRMDMAHARMSPSGYDRP
ncbi:hypothetical protein COCMIDRAFT_97430, partial [Bipolaris oryzae ATCC 44560]